MSLTATAPAIATVRDAAHEIAPWIVQTPLQRWPANERRLGLTADSRVFGKFEYLQRTGTFKARGALLNVLRLPAEARERGVTAVSAGNHAIATAYAAHTFGVSAKVVMLAQASPARVELCKSYGAEIVFADTVHEAFERVAGIVEREQRSLVHPFDSVATVTGTATLGLEIAEQLPDLDAVVVPVGGGGLCAGVASAIKQLLPHSKVYAVEPAGADSMTRSFSAGSPQHIEHVQTIADSLGAPMALEYTYNICRDNVDDIVTVSDDELRAAMRTLFEQLKIAVEPACAASTAAVCGPLRERLLGKKTVALLCGSNIDFQTYCRSIGD